MVGGRYPNPKYIALFPQANIEDVIVNEHTRQERIAQQF